MPPMRINDPVEFVYLTLMYRWETTAPPDRHEGMLDGDPARNSQIARLAYVLVKVATDEHIYSKLARYTRRNDGHSYISKDKSWMEQPQALSYGWFFEGCTSLVQKQEIVQHLTKVGLSARFAACVDDFVAGKTVKGFFPTEVETSEMLARIRAREADGDA